MLFGLFPCFCLQLTFEWSLPVQGCFCDCCSFAPADWSAPLLRGVCEELGAVLLLAGGVVEGELLEGVV